MTKSLVKVDKTAQRKEEVRQAFLIPEASSKSDHALAGQLAKTKTL